ncbi:DUF2514 family protein [Comamonas piscis]|uniref:DUF2514 family protein n=1 Tax=Comamonas piscis TaxID=1562974 RepID=A0A7G5EHW4_9BURK|nr:DUF2514 family protein [Comamonas piscis]QMV73589.1 DUF2514 family protein [Comamonas piscis]WSO32010.1 DUF2514 family protein [Comamonas piscis]
MKQQRGMLDLSMAAIVAGLVVLTVVVGLVQQNRISKLRLQHADTLTGIAQANTKAYEALDRYRAAVDTAGRALAQQIQTQEGETNAKIEALSDLAGIERASRLRDQRTYDDSIRHWQGLARRASTDGERQATAAAIGVLADLHARLDERAGVYAGQADQCRVRGLACERAYQTVADMINAGPPKDE